MLMIAGAVLLALVLLHRAVAQRRLLRSIEAAVGTSAFRIGFSDSSRDEKGFDKNEVVGSFGDKQIVFVAKTDPVTRVSDLKLFYDEKRFQALRVNHGDLKSPLARIHRKLGPAYPARKGGTISR